MKKKSSKKKINSRAKGAVGEREWAAWLRDNLGVEARRGCQFQGGADSPDVVSSLEGIHFEVKRVENLSLYKALEQAARDAGSKKVPVVAHRRNHKKWVLAFEAHRALEFLAALEAVVKSEKKEVLNENS